MIDMPVIDAVGYAAAGLVLATFCMRSMRMLRWMAIASNVAFIAYAYFGHLMPVLLQHVLLLPVNICRLVQLPGEHGSGVAVEERTQRGRNSAGLFSAVLKGGI